MAETTSKTERMPVLFVGHGSPMNAFGDNRWSRAFQSLRRMIPRPKAILAISAHWYVDGSWLTGNSSPRTIHDFYGFPEQMYEVTYPAAGNPQLAKRVRTLLADWDGGVSNEWGLDHGTWTVLRHVYPDGSVPIVQLSIDRRMSPAQVHRMAALLRELRYDGVLLFASGNITHNLADAIGRMSGSSHPETPDWARRFDIDVVDALAQRDTNRLLRLWPDTDDGRLAHPSPDHWFPLLYASGASDQDDEVTFPIEGFDGGSLSMRSVLFS